MESLVSSYCRSCGIKNSVLVDSLALMQFQHGVLVQQAFPDLTDQEREIIIGAKPTGYYLCSSCWENLGSE